MKPIEFAIIGAGHGGRAFAAYLAEAGHNVHLIYRTLENIATIAFTRRLKVEGVLEGEYELQSVTNNYAKTIRKAEIILLVVPASLHLDIAHKIIPYLRSGQIILLNPGRTWGAIEVYNEIMKIRPSLQVFVGETETLLFTSRKQGDFGVTIHKIKNSIDYCFYPEILNYEVQDIIETIFPQLHAVDDIKVTSLNNFGAILHPSIALLNTGSIARGTPFLFYRQGVTLEIARVIENLDKERMRIIRRLNIPLESFLGWVKQTYGYYAESYYDAFQKIQSYGEIVAPSELRVRYFTEDIPTGLVPLASLGRHIGIKTPMMNSIIILSSHLLGQDFFHTGRTLERVGVPMNVLYGTSKIPLLNEYQNEIFDRDLI